MPVVLIPSTVERPWPTDRPWRILAPLDGSPLSQAVLDPACQLAAALGAELLLLRVVQQVSLWVQANAPRVAREHIRTELEEARRYLRQVEERLRASRLSVATHTAVGAVPALGIATVAQDDGVDLIALATHGRGGWLVRLWVASWLDTISGG